MEDQGGGDERTQATPKKKARQKFVPDKPDGTPDRLEGRYMKPEKAPFHVEVKPEPNDLEPFDVSKLIRNSRRRPRRANLNPFRIASPWRDEV